MYICTLDPTESYPQLTDDYYREVCGVSASWFQMQPQPNTRSMVEIATECYQFPVYEIKEAKLRDDGFYMSYPSDPDLAPLMVIENIITGEQMFLYPHELFIFKVQTGERDDEGRALFKTISYRMD